MALDHLRLSPLPDVAAFLVERAPGNDALEDALQDALADEDSAAATQAVLAALPALLDAWLEEGRQVLYETSQELNPYAWLAISDHLDVVQQFRQLL